MGTPSPHPSRSVNKGRCGGEQHTIHISAKGRVRFPDHPGVSPQTLATEYEMMTDKRKAGYCAAIAFHLLRGAAVSSTNSSWEVHAGMVRLARFQLRRDAVVDPFSDSIRRRPSYILMQKVRESLYSVAFRSTPHVGHEVHVDVTRRTTRIFGTKDKTKTSKKDPTKNAMLTSWMSVIHAEISKSWARIWLLGVAVVGGQFVYEIVKQRSKTDLRIRFIQQSRGYTISYYEADIHKGSDGVWRIIEATLTHLEPPKNSFDRLIL